MGNRKQQLEAIETAAALISKLPPNTVWALCVTDDDDQDSPAVLNIYGTTASMLDLSDRLVGEWEIGRGYLMLTRGSLEISLITEEASK